MHKRSNKNSKNKKGKNFLTLFKLQTLIFIISGILLILAVSSVYSVYTEGKTAKNNAQQGLDKFEEIVLKAETSESQQPPSNPIEKTEVEYTPIAKLEVEKINLNVAVLSEWSYELLDISVNKFSGPEPNEPGNFIVIGHNYLNGSHFGSLNLLEIGDSIDFTDLSGRKITYEVYEILIIKPVEVEKLMTNKERTLTLVTCDDENDELRLVIKSKEINR